MMPPILCMVVHRANGTMLTIGSGWKGPMRRGGLKDGGNQLGRARASYLS
jgi:hypothetical protein